MSRRVKNIIVVSDTASNDGGVSQIACLTANILKGAGYGVTYFAGCGPVRSELKDIRTIVVRDGSFLKSASKVSGALEGLHSKASYEALTELLREFSPADTVVHVHGWTHALSSSIFDACADLGFRVIITVHEYFLVCPNGGFYDYQRNEICHRKPCSVGCVLRNCDKRGYAQKLYRVARAIRQNRSVRRAKPKLCYLSPFVRNILYKSGIDDDDPAYLPNPILAPKTFTPSDPTNRQGYLFVGRFDPEKNPKLFCEAITRLGLQGTMCGSGHQLETLEAQYPGIEFLGWCDKDQLSDQFRRHRALVMTSSWYEASPLVCLEAMFASGIPSIVPNTCGAIDYIKDGVNGALFENNDLGSLCSALERMENTAFYKGVCENIERELPELRKDRSYDAYLKRLESVYEAQIV